MGHQEPLRTRLPGPAQPFCGHFDTIAESDEGHHGLANVTLLDELFGSCQARIPTIVKIYHQLDTGASGRLYHLLALSNRVGHGLFDQDMLSSCKHPQDRLCVGEVRCCHADKLNAVVACNTVQVCRPATNVFVPYLSGTGWTSAPHSDEFRVWM
jgi:hypothetical protein